MSSNTDVRKAAVLLMSLPQQQASEILGKLQDGQVEAVTIEIARIGRVASDEQQAVICEFSDANPNHPQVAPGAAGRSIRAMPFSFLKHVDSRDLLTFIIDEHPQTIALVLSHLHPSCGAGIIAGLPGDRQTDVVRRIANMGPANPDVIHEVEAGLKSRMSGVMGQPVENAGGIQSVVQILNVSDRVTERGLLENLDHEDPDLAEEIRDLMFVFEDIAKLSDKDMQPVLRNVETSQWAMALKGASEELKQSVLDSMSDRASEMLAEEMDYLGPVRLSEVEAVQQQIADVIRCLKDADELSPVGGDGEAPFIS